MLNLLATLQISLNNADYPNHAHAFIGINCTNNLAWIIIIMQVFFQELFFF